MGARNSSAPFCLGKRLPSPFTTGGRGILSLFAEFFRFFHTLSFWEQWKKPKFGHGAAPGARTRWGVFGCGNQTRCFGSAGSCVCQKSLSLAGTGGLPRGCQPFTPSVHSVEGRCPRCRRRRSTGDSPIFACTTIGRVPASLARCYARRWGGGGSVGLRRDSDARWFAVGSLLLPTMCPCLIGRSLRGKRLA